MAQPPHIGPHSVASLETRVNPWDGHTQGGRIEFSVSHGDHGRPINAELHQRRDLKPHHIVVVAAFGSPRYLGPSAISPSEGAANDWHRHRSSAHDGVCKVIETVAMYGIASAGQARVQMLSQILEFGTRTSRFPVVSREDLPAVAPQARLDGTGVAAAAPVGPATPRRRIVGAAARTARARLPELACTNGSDVRRPQARPRRQASRVRPPPLHIRRGQVRAAQRRQRPPRPALLTSGGNSPESVRAIASRRGN